MAMELDDQELAVWAHDPRTKTFFFAFREIVLEKEIRVAEGGATGMSPDETAARYAMAVGFLDGMKEVLEAWNPDWRKSDWFL